jgi:GrpB-like predicted nucleotidyltransferase (UPF0157 family)
MKKNLSEMTFEELGKLFPIVLSDYNPQWAELYEAEKDSILNAVGVRNIYAIHHYGSTAVKGLKAKPTIDILLEIKGNTDLDALKDALIGIGYEFSWQKHNPPPHMMLMKGYTTEGYKGQAYHLHVRYKGDWDELLFRDYLRVCPEARQTYADLKTELQKQYQFDREGYTRAKGDFINATIKKAKEYFGG